MDLHLWSFRTLMMLYAGWILIRFKRCSITCVSSHHQLQRGEDSFLKRMSKKTGIGGRLLKKNGVEVGGGTSKDSLSVWYCFGDYNTQQKKSYFQSFHLNQPIKNGLSVEKDISFKLEQSIFNSLIEIYL